MLICTEWIFENLMASQISSMLLRDLFNTRGYNPKVLPQKSLNDTIMIEFRVDLIQIISVEEKSQVLRTNVWIMQKWSDYQLTWDPQSYDGLTSIRVAPEKIWKPDIVLLNNADGNYDWLWQPKAILESDGSLLWYPPAIYNSACTIDVEFFPFDQQECKIKFGSLTFSADQLMLNFDENAAHLYLTDYFVSGSWDLVGVDGLKEIGKIGGQKDKAQIIYTLKLRRKTLFYTVNLILPCIMISLLSICVFYLPADAGEKMTLSISILFALVVFLLLISKILPPTSTSIPLISKYLLFTFIINIFAIMVTVLIINWNYRTTKTHSMPKWVRRLFMELFPRVLMMRRPVNVEMELKLRSYLLNRNHQRNENGIMNDQACKYWPGGRPTINQVAPTSDNSSYSSEELAEFCQFCSNVNESSCTSGDTASACKDDADDQSTKPIDPAVCLTADLSKEQHKMLKTCVKKASSAISYISAKLHDDSEYELVYGDWKYVASVIDRLMLVLFVIVTTVGTFCIFIRAPYLFHQFDQQIFKRNYSQDAN